MRHPLRKSASPVPEVILGFWVIVQVEIRLGTSVTLQGSKNAKKKCIAGIAQTSVRIPCIEAKTAL